MNKKYYNKYIDSEILEKIGPIDLFEPIKFEPSEESLNDILNGAIILHKWMVKAQCERKDHMAKVYERMLKQAKQKYEEIKDQIDLKKTE